MTWTDKYEEMKTERRKKAARETAARTAKARANAVELAHPTLFRAEPRSNNDEYGPVHIVVKAAYPTQITKCGKAMRYASSFNRHTEESEECRRCGTHAEFLAVAEGEQQRREQAHIARKEKEAQERAEREKAYQEESAALDVLAFEFFKSGALAPCKKGRANYRQALSFTFNGRAYVITQGTLDKE